MLGKLTSGLHILLTLKGHTIRYYLLYGGRCCPPPLSCCRYCPPPPLFVLSRPSFLLVLPLPSFAPCAVAAYPLCSFCRCCSPPLVLLRCRPSPVLLRSLLPSLAALAVASALPCCCGFPVPSPMLPSLLSFPLLVLMPSFAARAISALLADCAVAAAVPRCCWCPLRLSPLLLRSLLPCFAALAVSATLPRGSCCRHCPPPAVFVLSLPPPSARAAAAVLVVHFNFVPHAYVLLFSVRYAFHGSILPDRGLLLPQSLALVRGTHFALFLFFISSTFCSQDVKMIPVLLNCYTAIITVAYGIMTRLAVCDLVSSGSSPRPEAWPLPADSRWADVSTGCDAVQRAWASLRCPVLQDVLAQQRAETLQMCGRPRCWPDVVAASTAAAARREALQKKLTQAVESAF